MFMPSPSNKNARACQTERAEHGQLLDPGNESNTSPVHRVAHAPPFPGFSFEGKTVLHALLMLFRPPLSGFFVVLTLSDPQILLF